MLKINILKIIILFLFLITFTSVNADIILPQDNCIWNESPNYYTYWFKKPSQYHINTILFFIILIFILIFIRKKQKIKLQTKQNTLWKK